MPSKKSTKKNDKIEQIAVKSAEEVSSEIQKIQMKTREALSQIDAALIGKQEELSRVIKAIEEKQEELEGLHGKENVLMSIDELKEVLADGKHDTDRALKKLSLSFKDAKEENERTLRKWKQEIEEKAEAEERTRRIKLEDEDRARAILVEEENRKLDTKRGELDKLAAELGSFDERLKAEVGKAKGMAERNAQIEVRQRETEHKAIVDILEAKLQQAVAEIESMKQRVDDAERASHLAQEKASAIAASALDKENVNRALEKVSSLASDFAGSGKR